jgi:small-conductance mechanosensitive channel
VTTNLGIAQSAIYENPVFFWAVGLVLGFPLLLVASTELLIRLQRHRHPAEDLVRGLRNLLLPTGAVLLLLTKILSDSSGSHVLRVTQTLLWIALIHTGLTTLNVVIFGISSESSWRGRVPKLLLDISRSLLILVGSGIVLSTVWQADLKGLMAALGLGSLVIGWALQDTLSNIIGGFVLLFERSFGSGDWIKIGETIGRVTEVTWRSVQLLTRGNEQIILPNAALAKAPIVNYSRPSAIHYEFVRLSFSAKASPNQVKDLLRQTAGDLEEIDRATPVPVLVLSMDHDSVLYLVRLPVLDYAAAPRVVDGFLCRIWYAARRHGLSLAGSQRYLALPEPGDVAQSPEERQQRLAQFAGFAQLPAEVLAQVAREARILRYGRGERILRPGEPLGGMWLLLHGTAELRHYRDGQPDGPALTLSAGEVLGEEALLGSVNSLQAVTATADCELLLLPEAALQHLIRGAPGSVREIGQYGRARSRETRAQPRRPS